MFPHVALDCARPAIRNHEGLNLSAALQQSHHGGLVSSAGSGDAALTLGDVHVAGFTADESLIGLNRTAVAAQLHHGAVLHSLANPMKHEPRGFLSDSQRPRNLAGANAVLRSGDEPHGREPLFEAQGRVLEDGSNLGGELALRVAALTLPLLLVRQISSILAATGRAFDAIGPAMCSHVSQAIIRVCEVNDCFLEGLWRFHVLRIGQFS